MKLLFRNSRCDNNRQNPKIKCFKTFHPKGFRKRFWMKWNWLQLIYYAKLQGALDKKSFWQNFVFTLHSKFWGKRLLINLTTQGIPLRQTCWLSVTPSASPSNVILSLLEPVPLVHFSSHTMVTYSSFLVALNSKSKGRDSRWVSLGGIKWNFDSDFSKFSFSD